MTNLPEKYPSVYEAFKTGQFSVQPSNNNTFWRIPVDQAIEVTVNKGTQTPGGTSRFSWSGHSELQSPRIQKDEEAVSAVVSLIQGWINLFDGI